MRDNRDGLSKSIRQLSSVMSAIASEKDNLRSALEIAPTAMDSLHLGFDHSHRFAELPGRHLRQHLDR